MKRENDEITDLFRSRLAACRDDGSGWLLGRACAVMWL